ncbi:UNVERIFIED_CONTAM: hypothetical protein PYX00_004388 [Menopon gallinae]|uniref:Ig-like domain-containing protein n=1 Tax=Menopon gallinae TaxID=328185 RepID=A0AAW2I3Y3_9NEOP
MRKTWEDVTILLISAFIITLPICVSALDSENEVIEVPVKPQIVKYEVLDEPGVVKLKCNILKNSFKRNRIMSVHELRWERKNCGYGLNLINCGNHQTIPWTSVMCKNGSKFCDGYTLKLENPSVFDSGYYRCLYKNYMSRQFKVYKMFYLDVYDQEQSFEVLEEPSYYDNRNVYINETVIFRCRARSLSPLHMIWVKIVPPDYKGIRPVQYETNNYELLENGGTYNIGNDLYISKLTIPNCQTSDNGQYYCIIVNVNNASLLKNKSVSLVVMPRYQNKGYVIRGCRFLQLLTILLYYIVSVVATG